MKKLSLVFLFCLLSLQLFADDDDKQKLAVMEFEDLSGTLSPETLAGATEYIRGAFVSTNKYIVIAKERQEKAMIKEMKKESYKACNDKNCQIPLGQALSADTILRTTISFFGGFYTITSELIDLAKEATIVGAKQTFDGSERSLALALDKIVEQIVGTTISRHAGMVTVQEHRQPETVKPDTSNDEKEKEEKIKAEEEKIKAEEEKRKAEEQQKAAEEKRKAEEETRKIKDELNQAGRSKRLAIATSTLVAGVVVGALGGVSFYGMSKAKKDHDKYLEEYRNARDQETIDHFRKKTSDAESKYKTYLILGGVGIGVGVALIATGITFYSIEFEGEKEVNKKYNLSLGANPADGTIQFALRW